MAVVTPLNNPGGPEGDTVTMPYPLLSPKSTQETVRGNTTGPMGFPPLTPLAPPGSALLGGAGGTEEGKNERNKGEALAHFPISHMRPQGRTS